MFADIAPSYDLLNSMMCLRLHRRWRALAVSRLQLQPGQSALDVCCGTGDFLIPLRRAVGPGGLLVGSDFCLPMLDLARKKDPAPLSLGDACCLPFADSTFDAITVGWGIRNVPDIDRAHREAFRVLKPGGRFVSLDMARPRGRLIRSLSEWTFRTITPRLGALFGKTSAYRYLPESTQRFMSREELKTSMESAGLTNVNWRDLFFGNICIHEGQKP
jgi:demethylmenaquinone methyltransferase/2-methoxy-6-polyprenyl-1,4-benzoquinol methylase